MCRSCLFHGAARILYSGYFFPVPSLGGFASLKTFAIFRAQRPTNEGLLGYLMFATCVAFGAEPKFPPYSWQKRSVLSHERKACADEVDGL